MQQLVYISAASHYFSEEEFSSLLQTSRHNNHIDQITGILMYHEQQFFQILEGPKETVDACFSRIKKDPRHQGVITLLDDTSPERLFGEWNMAAVGVSSFEEPLRHQIQDLLQIRNHQSYDQMHTNKVIGIFVDTYLSDLNRFASEVRF